MVQSCEHGAPVAVLCFLSIMLYSPLDIVTVVVVGRAQATRDERDRSYDAKKVLKA
jgi:hypothetical protein